MDISKAQCANCDGSMEVRQMTCPDCDIRLEADFEIPALARLSLEDQMFIVAPEIALVGEHRKAGRTTCSVARRNQLSSADSGRVRPHLTGPTRHRSSSRCLHPYAVLRRRA